MSARFFRPLQALLAFLIFALNPISAFAEPLEAEERVLFFPDIAVVNADNSVNLTVQAWVYEEEGRRYIASLLARMLDVDVKKLSAESSALFWERTKFFRADSDSFCELSVNVNGETVALPSTNYAGRSHATVTLTGALNTETEGGATVIPYTLIPPANYALAAPRGAALLVPREGVSVVSDIDDTIKSSYVLDRDTLLKNTFIEPFVSVPGMASWYRSLQKNQPGIAFHYLSSSPWQLYPALSEFLRREGFPNGSFHLRESTSLVNIVPRENSGFEHKIGTLRRLFRAMPERRFILVGDSGERDPEIYAQIAEEFPGRVINIVIRNVTGEPPTALRYRDKDKEVWRIVN